MNPSGIINKTQSYINVENDANLILKQVGIYHPPVPIKIIQKIFNEITLDVLEFHEDAFGFSYPSDGVWHILVNDHLPSSARRFTVFHEFYHILNDQIDFSRSSTEGQFEEQKANYFASCILMPARWIRIYWDKYHDPDLIAKIFMVSRAAVNIRLEGLQHYLGINNYR